MLDLKMFDNKILICSKRDKEIIYKQIEQSDTLYNINFITLDQFYTSLTFEISKKMLFFVMTYYNVKVDVAKTYVSSLKDIYFSEEINNNKVKFLFELKQLLINKGFIKKSNILNYYNSNSIIVYGYHFIEKKYLKALSLINNKEIIYPACINKKKMVVREFKNIEDEICYVYEQISKLLHDGIDINNIKITGVTKDYYFLLKKLSKMYNLPITITNETSLYDVDVCKEFLDCIQKNEHLQFLEHLKEKNNKYYNKIINILNEYSFVSDYKDIYGLLVRDFKNSFINIAYKNDIKVIGLNEVLNNIDEHVFILGFNQGNIPSVLKDEDYLSDDVKEILGMSRTSEINKAVKEETMNLIFSLDNAYLSYSLASSFNDLIKSSAITEYGIDVITNTELDYNYSHKYNNYSLACKLDDYNKYTTQTQSLSLLYSNYGLSEYDSYDNKFKGINNNFLREQLHNQVKLSYTSLNTYNECKFKYFVERILKINKYETTFSTKLGIVFHYVLSKAFDEGFDFEKEFEYSVGLELNDITAKEKFLLIKLKEELKFIIDEIKNQLVYINYDKCLYEEKVTVNLNKNCKIKFEGTIDKVFYKEEENDVYVVLIDYKTYDKDCSLLDCKFGLNLQLPVYMYLSKKSNRKEVYVTGFYYQDILYNGKKAETEEEHLENKQNYLKLQGYTVDMPQNLKFDLSDDNSNIIKGLRKNKDGSFNKNSKIISMSDMNKLEKLVEKSICDAGNGIINGDFEINPLVINENNVSCQMCKYQDICFKSNNDLNKMQKPTDLSFLTEYE